MVETHGIRIAAIPESSRSVSPAMAVGSFLKTRSYICFEVLVADDQVFLQFIPSGGSKSEQMKALSFVRSFLAGQGILQNKIKDTSIGPLELENYTRVVVAQQAPQIIPGGFGRFPDIGSISSLSDQMAETFLGAERKTKGLLQIILRRVNVPRRYKALAKRRIDTHDSLQHRNERERALQYYNELVETGCFEVAVRALVTAPITQEADRLVNQLSGFLGQLRMDPAIHPDLRHCRRLGPTVKAIRKRRSHSSFISSGRQMGLVLRLPSCQHRGFTVVTRTEFGPPPQPISKLNKTNIQVGVPIVNGVQYRQEQQIDISRFTGHAALWGSTGEGKSRLVASFVSQFADMGKKILIIDPKGDYLDLLGDREDFLYFKIGSREFPLGINLFQIPEYIERREDYIELVRTAIVSAVGGKDNFGPQMMEVLGKAITHTVHRRGNFEKFLKLLRNPDAEKILKVKGYNLQTTFAALENRIAQIFGGSAGDAFRVKKSTINMKTLLETNVILDISAFEQLENDISRTIFLEVLMHLLAHWLRFIRPVMRDHGDFSNVIVIDEVQKVLPQRYPLANSAQQSLLGKAPWSIRAYGVAMIFSGTEPTVEYPIITQPALIFMFRCKHDNRQLASMLNVSLDQYRELSNQLDRRLCVISEGGARPYIVRTPDFIPSPITEGILNRLQNHPMTCSSRELFESTKIPAAFM
ncbi:MAG: helicase HerA domain-containing protein [Candidatus Hodarchaeota archaeon]